MQPHGFCSWELCRTLASQGTSEPPTTGPLTFGSLFSWYKPYVGHETRQPCWAAGWMLNPLPAPPFGLEGLNGVGLFWYMPGRRSSASFYSCRKQPRDKFINIQLNQVNVWLNVVFVWILCEVFISVILLMICPFVCFYFWCTDLIWKWATDNLTFKITSPLF